MFYQRDFSNQEPLEENSQRPKQGECGIVLFRQPNILIEFRHGIQLIKAFLEIVFLMRNGNRRIFK